MDKATWKQLAASLSTFVVGMVAFWLVEGREYATRAEVALMISQTGPYIEDRKAIAGQLAESARVQRELTTAINGLRVELAEVSAQLRHLSRAAAQISPAEHRTTARGPAPCPLTAAGP